MIDPVATASKVHIDPSSEPAVEDAAAHSSLPPAPATEAQSGSPTTAWEVSSKPTADMSEPTEIVANKPAPEDPAAQVLVPKKAAAREAGSKVATTKKAVVKRTAASWQKDIAAKAPAPIKPAATNASTAERVAARKNQPSVAGTKKAATKKTAASRKKGMAARPPASAKSMAEKVAARKAGPKTVTVKKTVGKKAGPSKAMGAKLLAKPLPTVQASPESSMSKPAKATPMAAVEDVAKAKAKPVRDSFTMPRQDFELIAALKDRALNFKRPAKKSELLRAGLHALQSLADVDLRTALDSLVPLKAGRPKK